MSKTTATDLTRPKRDFDRVAGQHAEVTRKLQALEAEVSGMRATMGANILEGGDLTKLTGDLAHKERELAALRAAYQASAGIVGAAGKAMKDAEQAAGLEAITTAGEAMAERKRAILPAMEKVIAELRELQAYAEAAAAAYDSLPYLGGNVTSEWGQKVQSITRTPPVLLAKAAQLRDMLR